MKKTIENIIKNNKLINKMFTFLGSIPVKLLGLFVKKESKSILFVSYMGKSFNDSPKVLFDSIIKDKYFDDYKLIWAFKDINKFEVPDRVEVVKIDTLQYFKDALKSEYWITNVNIERGLHFKKKYTTYINTWHGIPFKKIGNDVKGRSDFNFQSIDYFPYSGYFEYQIYKRAFKTNDDNMFMTGMPRNDLLMNGNDLIEKKIKEEYNIGNKKTILYAPTWRDDETDLKPLDMNIWNKVLKDNYVLLIRAHGLTEKLNIDTNTNVINVSDYPETSELLLATDILVTDYSSIMFDYSLLEKPMVFYVPDYDKYVDERGSYFDLFDTDISVYRDEEEVVDSIINLDIVSSIQNTKKFKNHFFDTENSNSSDSIIQYIKKQG